MSDQTMPATGKFELARDAGEPLCFIGQRIGQVDQRAPGRPRTQMMLFRTSWRSYVLHTVVRDLRDTVTATGADEFTTAENLLAALVRVGPDGTRRVNAAAKALLERSAPFDEALYAATEAAKRVSNETESLGVSA